MTEIVHQLNTTMAGPLAQLYAALAAAQGEFQPIVKNRDVVIATKNKQTGAPTGSYKFRYADLDEITNKTRPALSKNGLAVFGTVASSQQGNIVLEACLAHAGGATITSALDIGHPNQYPDPKQLGATITYLRRYMVTNMLGVAADDDLDEDGREPGADDHGAGQQQPAGQKPAVKTPTRRAPPAVGQTPAERDAIAGALQRAQAPAAPAPGPDPEDAQDDSGAAAAAAEIAGTPCTTGEVNYIKRKLEAAGMSIDMANTALEKQGLVETVETLSKTGFELLKDLTK